MRQAGDFLQGGAPGAGSLLLNTKASQEAARSRATAAIVPGQEPEPHDAGVSRFSGNGSHLAGADAAEGHAGQVGGSGSSGNTGNGLTPGVALSPLPQHREGVVQSEGVVEGEAAVAGAA